MGIEAKVHVVNKANNTEHATITADASHLPPLEPDSVRLQTRLVSLTANNLTYARLGSFAKWWDAFPVPNFLPEPYSDTNAYGIVPVWGYAEVISSKIADIPTGTIVYGFWPSSSLPVDLQLAPAEPAGHYVDTTPHRQTLWSYYHRYVIVPSSIDLSSPVLAAETVFKPLFECAHSLNAYVLGSLAIHPAPQANPTAVWNAIDATKSAVIALSASGKTARCFTDAVLNTRAQGNEPAAFVAVTSYQSKLSIPGTKGSPTKVLTTSYEIALKPETVAFLPESISNVVIVDFGAPTAFIVAFLAHLRQSRGLPITLIGVGGECVPSTSALKPEDLLASMAAVPDRSQMNTSEVREAVTAAIGAEAYFHCVDEGWRGFCERNGCEGVDVKLTRGVEGLEESWKALCTGKGRGGFAVTL